MEGGQIIGSLDFATLLFIAFVAFFIGLVFYLQRESRREGYPLESDTTGKLEPGGDSWLPRPKTYLHPDGSVAHKPDNRRDPGNDKLKRLAVWPGAPSEPVGDPMTAGVGPGAYTLRDDKPDVTHTGEPKLVPMRLMPEFSVAKQNADPRGFDVVGCDGELAGKVTDMWIDRAEALIRYYEVELADQSRKVLLPYAFANVKGKARQIRVSAVMAKHFADVPAHASPEQVTRLEEDRISAYYGGGILYATPKKLEPWI
ncbi:MAG: photosynthetic reaction center subunit H [Oceanicaulis sp.]